MIYRGEYPWTFDTDRVSGVALARFARQCVHIVASVAAYAPSVQLPWANWVSDISERIEAEVKSEPAEDVRPPLLSPLAQHCAHVACDVVSTFDEVLGRQ